MHDSNRENSQAALPPSKIRTLSLWSFLRNVLSQGRDIYLDHEGKGYEEYSARLDAAARERADELERALGSANETESELPESLRDPLAVMERGRRILAEGGLPLHWPKRGDTCLLCGGVWIASGRHHIEHTCILSEEPALGSPTETGGRRLTEPEREALNRALDKSVTEVHPGIPPEETDGNHG